LNHTTKAIGVEDIDARVSELERCAEENRRANRREIGWLRKKVIGRIERLEEYLGIGKGAPAPLTIEVVFVSADGETTTEQGLVCHAPPEKYVFFPWDLAGQN
jgi:hypothetical protein